MTSDLHVHDAGVAAGAEPPVSSRRLLLVLVALIAAATVVIAVALGYVWGNGGGSSGGVRTPSNTGVDAGFARDMTTHHSQAVTMASYARDNTADPALKILAYDIESEQSFQIGQMQGWLDTWGLPRNDPGKQMAWMVGHSLEPDGLMPGVATPDQVNKLETLHGTALDILFLQLMIHHHQGGVTMAQYAQQHATLAYVRNLAQSMVNQQSSEIIAMEQMLRSLGGTPLAPPDN